MFVVLFDLYQFSKAGESETTEADIFAILISVKMLTWKEKNK